MELTSLRWSLGKSISSQFAPASRLRNSNELMPPASTTFAFPGSRVTAVAVPPKGPVIFQSGTEAEPAQAATPIAATVAVAAQGRKRRLIIFGNICFGKHLYCEPL